MSLDLQSLRKVRPRPCAFCPYRKDVPSGIWDASEYQKLVAYDRPTPEQPFAVSGCHEKTGFICAGWAQCHGWELIALRIIANGKPLKIPEITVPIFQSGYEAAKHGLRRI